MGLKCKVCGKVLPTRSVSLLMEHLIRQHTAYFVDKVEREFYEEVEEEMKNEGKE